VSLAEVRRRCLRQISALDLPDPVSVKDVCERVAALRGRPIRVLRHGLPPGSPCGLRIATPAADYLVVKDTAVPAHQDLIVLHELGHVLFDPDTGPPLSEELAGALVPVLDPATVTCMLSRSSRFDLPGEQAAEVFGTLLLGRTSRWAPGAPRVVAPGADEFVGRIERTLERRAGRRLVRGGRQ
jgi:hypothetical protein